MPTEDNAAPSGAMVKLLQQPLGGSAVPANMQLMMKVRAVLSEPAAEKSSLPAASQAKAVASPARAGAGVPASPAGAAAAAPAATAVALPAKAGQVRQGSLRARLGQQRRHRQQRQLRRQQRQGQGSLRARLGQQRRHRQQRRRHAPAVARRPDCQLVRLTLPSNMRFQLHAGQAPASASMFPLWLSLGLRSVFIM